MKNTTKYLTLFAGAVALISCGSGPSKGETISKMIETIEKDNQFETDMGVLMLIIVLFLRVADIRGE